MNNQTQDCTVCHGKGINKVELQDLNKNPQPEFHPIECQHCKGTGKEPNQNDGLNPISSDTESR